MTAVAPVPAAAPPPSANGTATITATGVSKWMGSVVALSDVSFSIGPGVTALLGPNGAGKSTLLRILCGLTGTSQGSVRVLGDDPRTSLAVRRSLGLVAQQEGLFESLTAMELVVLSAGLHEIARPEAAAAAALATVGLDTTDIRPVRAYSKGMRQRVKVAMTLAHGPTIVLLDEPLEGLDPRQRLRMIELFSRLGSEGRTVLVSSHVLDEVERFGSNVLVLAKGRLAAQGDFHAIRELMDDRPHRLRVRTDAPTKLGAGLLTTGSVVGVWVESPQSLVVDTQTVGAFRRSVITVASTTHSRLYEVSPLDDDLDSVFRYLVAK